MSLEEIVARTARDDEALATKADLETERRRQKQHRPDWTDRAEDAQKLLHRAEKLRDLAEAETRAQDRGARTQTGETGASSTW